MSDINLLPEDLRNEEEKEQAKKKFAGPAPAFHLPQEKEISKAATEDKIPVSVNGKRQWEAVEKAEPPGKKPAPPPFKTFAEKSFKAEKPRPGLGFFGRLFKKKEKKEISKRVEPTPAALGLPTNLVKDIERLSKEDKEKVLPPPNNITLQNQEKKDKRQDEAKKKLVSLKPKSTIFGRAIDVNLLPEGAGLLLTKKLVSYFSLAAVMGIILSLAVYLGLSFYKQGVASQLKQLDNQILLLDQNFKELKVKEQEAVSWSSQVEAVEALIKNHIYWTKFFPELEKVTIPEVYYTAIAASADGYVTLTAAAPNYTSLAKQYIVLQGQQDIFPEMEISGLAGSEQGVAFSIQLKLSPELYYSLAEKK